MKKVLKAIWQFCSYVFVPQRRSKDYYNLWNMTQNENGIMNYEGVMNLFIINHRNLSKYALEERWLYARCKHCKKQMNTRLLKPERIEPFNHLLSLMEQYKRKKQYE